MNTLFLILLAAGFVWVIRKLNKTSEDVRSIEARAARLEWDLERLKQRLDSADATARSPEPTAARVLEPTHEFGEADAAPATREVPRSLPRPTIHGTATEPARSSDVGAATTRQPEAALPSTAVPPPLIPSAQPSTLIPCPEPSPAAARLRTETPPRGLNWERFMGVNLFAWIGGLALFLGVAFFVKYSFERNLIPPELRVAIGFLTGLALLAGGVMMKRKESIVTAQTLSATGVLVLYGVSFACHAYYHFTGSLATFLLMTLITATAFLLAVRMGAKVVAVLGLVGGFLTPPLLSTGVDDPLGLFTYIALLDLGLMAVAFHRRWHFLALLGAAGTVVMQLGWVGQFFAVEKVFIALAVFLGFDLLFLLAFVVGEKLKQTNRPVSIASMVMPFVTLGFAGSLLASAELGQRPATLFSFVLGADLCLLALVLARHPLHAAHLIGGGVAFLILAGWTAGHLTAALLNWALGFYLLFAILHSAFPVVLQRLRPGVTPVWWGHLFPPVALLLVLLPLVKETGISWAIWPCVLLIDLVAVGLALLTTSMLAVLGVVVLTSVVTGVWILKIPAEVTGMPPLLTVIGGFALFFFFVSLFVEKKILARIVALETTPPLGATSQQSVSISESDLVRQIPALAAILPFLLLIMAILRLPTPNPSSVFGLGLLLLGLMLWVARATATETLVATGLGSILALEYSWHATHFAPSFAAIPLAWYLVFAFLFLLFPFVFPSAFRDRSLPWAVAALSPVLHFFPVYQTVSLAYPNGFMGLLPAAFALPMLGGLFWIVRRIPSGAPHRNALLAWFGGSALFFITLIFPIQFERQWITIGWALEGSALLWLFHRVPHAGLRATGVGLLAIAFARLALNPWILEYQPRSSVPIFNWYLYTYAVPALCLLVGARLLAPPRNMIGKVNLPPWLYGAGAVLLFLVLNIEIADYFSSGPVLVFQFSDNFARDMTYSIAWALFAFALLVLGIWKRARPLRYASVGLLAVTLLKLFFHDLGQLDQLYRIGAFIGVAIVLILASYLYQRFVSWDTGSENSKN